jgi:hypothetical protein
MIGALVALWTSPVSAQTLPPDIVVPGAIVNQAINDPGSQTHILACAVEPWNYSYIFACNAPQFEAALVKFRHDKPRIKIVAVYHETAARHIVRTK